MTDPTNLRARAEDERPCDIMARVSRLARIGVIVEAWRADDDADGVDAMVAITAILRESALPPEAPGERRPVAGWVDRGEFYELVLIDTPCCRVLARAWNDGGWSIVSVTTAMAVTATIRNGRGDISLTGAQLAAEDAADALLLAGRRALGRVA